MHEIFIESYTVPFKELREKYNNIPIINATYAGQDPSFVFLSPMYPHGDIPVPFTNPQLTAASVEAIWQGLKVFEYEGAQLDEVSLNKYGCKNIKRRSNLYRGRILGHQHGTDTAAPLFNLMEARAYIYAPTYLWQLDHKCQKCLSKLRDMLEQTDIVLLEAGRPAEIADPKVPIRHTELIRAYLYDEYPDIFNFI